MVMLVHPKKIEFARKFNKWFLLSIRTFNNSPLICSKCKTVMQFQYFVPDGGNNEKEWQVYRIHMP